MFRFGNSAEGGTPKLDVGIEPTAGLKPADGVLGTAGGSSVTRWTVKRSLRFCRLQVSGLQLQTAQAKSTHFVKRPRLALSRLHRQMIELT